MSSRVSVELFDGDETFEQFEIFPQTPESVLNFQFANTWPSHCIEERRRGRDPAPNRPGKVTMTARNQINQRIGSLLMAVSVLCGVAMSVHPCSAQEPTFVRGKATLLPEDLKTLIGLKPRNPSSEEETAGLSPNDLSFQVELSAQELVRVKKILAKLDRQRSALQNRLSSESEQQKETIRSKRRAVQLARTSGTQESSLGKALFENLLDEANLEAKNEQQLSDFDSQNSITVEYFQRGEVKLVDQITIGQQVAWSRAARSALARK